MSFLSDDELKTLLAAEEAAFPSPVPVQVVSSDEYLPEPQSKQQKQVQARLTEMADSIAAKQGISRRRFFQTASGLAASFAAMNAVYGTFFDAPLAEAQTPEMANERAGKYANQFVMDMHTHFLRDDTKLTRFANMRAAVGKAGWNTAIGDKPQTVDDLKYANYFKEIYLDSDTKVALISNAPSERPEDWFLTDDMVFEARAKVNKKAGTRRMLGHFTMTPGMPGWLDRIDRAIGKYRPDSWKGYTLGDNTNKDLSRHPYHLDDEKLMYPAYERFLKSGIRNVCVHKGLFPPGMENDFPNLYEYADVRDVAKAAKDWPQLNFIIYHSGYRHIGGDPAVAMAEWDKTGRISWVTELSEIPSKYGVTNVYGDLGQLFAYSVVVQPRLAAAMMGTLIRGLGADHVCWGTDAVWTGSPQWQIEGLRRLEIPEEMQKQHGFQPLGAPDGPVKSAIFTENNVRLYNFQKDREQIMKKPDAFHKLKAEYRESGPEPSNLRYGYVAPSRG